MREVLLVESEIPENFACENQNPGPWNPEYSSKNPESHYWNPESQPRPQGFSLKKWVGPFFKGKALGTRLPESKFH